MPDSDFLVTVAVLALVSFGCRSVGYLLMRFVRITPRVQAGLQAVPLAAMIGIVVPSAVAGGVPEWGGLAAVTLAMRLSGQELVAAVAGLAAVALLRAAGF